MAISTTELERIIQEADVSNRAFARELSVSDTAVRGWLKGETVSAENEEKIRSFAGKNTVSTPSPPATPKPVTDEGFVQLTPEERREYEKWKAGQTAPPSAHPTPAATPKSRVQVVPVIQETVEVSPAPKPPVASPAAPPPASSTPLPTSGRKPGTSPLNPWMRLRSK